MKKYQEFNLGNIKLLSGKTLNSAKLIYKTYGKINRNGSNVILLPTFYTGTHTRNEGFIGKNRVINPNKYFIVSINMFGNGLSSSPSNTKKSPSSMSRLMPFKTSVDPKFLFNSLIFKVDIIILSLILLLVL